MEREKTYVCTRCGRKGPVGEMSNRWLTWNGVPVCPRIRCPKCGHTPHDQDFYEREFDFGQRVSRIEAMDLGQRVILQRVILNAIVKKTGKWPAPAKDELSAQK